MYYQVLCMSFCALICTTSFAQSEPTLEEMLAAEGAPAIIKVEEDWEVMVGDPLPDSNLPQIVTVFGPTNANFGTHTLFELNHGTLPSFAEGGMQLQVWWGDSLIGYRSQHFPTELSHNSEKITYTTVTSLNDDRIYMYIKNGISESFGNFGGTWELAIGLDTFRDDLNPYDQYNSINHSRVTFGANRVNRFVRREIRFYSADGLYVKESTSRYVHRLAIDVELTE